MISLYNNKSNKRLKFRMDIKGVESSSIIPRLVIESYDKSKAILINGIIEDNVCYFNIPELTNFEKGEKTKIFYEAIVAEEQYAKLWEDNVDVDTKTQIKVVENSVTEEEQEEKKIDLKDIKESGKFVPTFEDVDEEDEEDEEIDEGYSPLRLKD